jgi:S1-C subfamily serine protease
MDDILLLEATERYMRGEMTPQEKTFFEEVRKNNPPVDQLVVEHIFLLNELDKHAGIKAYKHAVQEVENKLTEEGVISKLQLKGKARVSFIWKKYKRSIAVAATIAGLVSLVTTGLIVSYNNKVGNSNITELIYKIDQTKKKVDQLDNKLKANNSTNPTLPNPDYRATGFLIDGDGYLVTNAHVVNKMKNIYVENNKGEYYSAVSVFTDATADLAILKISDTAFKAVANLPYSIKKTNSDLGEQIFTLGYPRNEIVYGEGYLSAKSGNDGDSTAYQVSVSVNPGNSGGPVMNKNGEIIGIITSKNSTADGVVYAAKSKNIFRLLDNLKKDDGTESTIKLPSGNGLKGLERTLQVKKMEEFVFMVVGN